MSKLGSDLEEDHVISRLLQQLTEQAQDVTDSLDRFTSEREVALDRQKRAIAEYEAEMRALEREELGEYDETEEEQPKYTDPNIMRHLNIDKQSEYYNNLAQNLKNEERQESSQGRKMNALDFASLEKKNTIEVDNRPKPTFDQKKKLRETMFLLLDESSIEETRLELAYEEAKECGDYAKASELAEALYITQKMNSDRLNGLINDYKPEAFTKNWGNDPDYAQLMKQFHNMLPNDTLEEVTAPHGKKKK